MNSTANFGLKKPESNEYVNIGDLNDNADIVDRELKNVNDRVDAQGGVKSAHLSASGWSSATPYVQTVDVAGVKAVDAPIIGISIATDTTAANVKLQNKAWGCVDRAVTGAGIVTFYCYNKKPATDFDVNIKGV